MIVELNVEGPVGSFAWAEVGDEVHVGVVTVNGTWFHAMTNPERREPPELIAETVRGWVKLRLRLSEKAVAEAVKH